MSKLYFVTAKNGNSEIDLVATWSECKLEDLIVNHGRHVVLDDAELFTLNAVDGGDLFAIEATESSAQAIIDELVKLADDEKRWIPLATIEGTKAWCESIMIALYEATQI